MSVIKLNEELQKEGRDLLDRLNLMELLRSFGPVEIGGSFIYGTMVDRDIDIAVIVNKHELNLELRKNFINELLNIKELDGLEMTDRVQPS
jgi:hypothetical protein